MAEVGRGRGGVVKVCRRAETLFLKIREQAGESVRHGKQGRGKETARERTRERATARKRARAHQRERERERERERGRESERAREQQAGERASELRERDLPASGG